MEKISGVSDLSDIKFATAIVNPVSSSSKKGQKRLERLIKASPFEISTINSSHDHEKTERIIRDSLERSDLLLVVAGDGMFNRVVNTIIANNLSDRAKQVPVWSLSGGNAEDGTKANHTRLHQRHPEHVLNDGRIVKTHPIRVEYRGLEDEDEPATLRSAAFYAAVGSIALTAGKKYLDNPKHRNRLGRNRPGRFLSEPIITARGMLAAQMNTVVQDGKERRFYTELFANSPIMAKYFHFDTRITEPELFHAVIEKKRIGSVAAALYKARNGLLEGDYFDTDDQVTFDTKHDLWLQCDGEAEIIPSYSQVNISINEQPIWMVVTDPDLYLPVKD